MTTTSRFCEQCGSALAEGVTFCESCGAAVPPDEPATPTPPATEPTASAPVAPAPVTPMAASPAAPTAARTGGAPRWLPVLIMLIGVVMVVASIVSAR